MSSQRLNLQQMWKGLTLEARMPWRSAQGKQQPNKGAKKGRSRGPKQMMMLIPIKITTLMKLMELQQDLGQPGLT